MYLHKDLCCVHVVGSFSINLYVVVSIDEGDVVEGTGLSTADSFQKHSVSAAGVAWDISHLDFG